MNLDKTFCPFSHLCVDGKDCDRGVTEELMQELEAARHPLWTFVAPPKDCYVPIDEGSRGETNG